MGSPHKVDISPKINVVNGIITQYTKCGYLPELKIVKI